MFVPILLFSIHFISSFGHILFDRLFSKLNKIKTRNIFICNLHSSIQMKFKVFLLYAILWSHRLQWSRYWWTQNPDYFRFPVILIIPEHYVNHFPIPISPGHNSKIFKNYYFIPLYHQSYIWGPWKTYRADLRVIF